MPPQLKKSTQSSARAVVPAGPKQVFKNAATTRPENKENQRPTTTKALVLRNGKYGAMGTGELVLATKMGGREKLDLLSEDYARRAATAIRSPFRLEECVKMAGSQLNAYLDEISSLQDPTLFYSKVRDEAHARLPLSSRPNAPDPIRNPSFMASIVSNKIHNMYMLASAWNLVRETLFELGQAGLEDRSINSQLNDDENIRSNFFVLRDIVGVIVDACQANFAVLTTTATHFSEYFKQSDDIDEPEFSFDWTSLKGVHKSFLDSIIVELCLPNSQISKPILFEILHEAVEEAPQDARRFPQALWDAVGDFAVTVQLQDLLDGPLLGSEGQTLNRLTRTMPEEYEQWIDAQIFSSRASRKYANFKDIIYPVEKTRNGQVLESMWRLINLNYESVSGVDIDRLWNLTEVRDLPPHWHAVYIPNFRKNVPESASKNNGGRNARLAITSGDPDDSDDSMPSLQTVSDSSDVDDVETDSESDVYSDFGAEYRDEESDCDSDEEEGIKDMIREAMNIAMSIPEFTDIKTPIPEFDALAEDRKDNPFLKLLGALRGRIFSSSPTLKTTTRDQPRRPHADAETPSGRSTARKKSDSKHPESAGTQSQKTTVEEVEDEESTRTSPKKKKKKPKKKKKASSTTSESAEKSPVIGPAVQIPSSPTSPVGPSPANNIPSTPTKGKKTAESTSKVPVPTSPTASTIARPFESSASLPLPTEQIAQSAHAYIQSEGLANQKSKVKSRPDYGNLITAPKQGFFAKFGKRKDKTEEEEEEEEDIRGNTNSWFSRLGKKTAVYMRQLVGADDKLAPMKWENFLKVMREMGFRYDPSTAGSSVRFDPPDPKDRSITFHKPHPDPTLTPIMLKDFGKRLKKSYGWSEADFFGKLES